MDRKQPPSPKIDSVFRVYEKETFDYNVILRGETPTGFVRPCDAHLPEAWDGATKLHVTLVGLRAPGDAFYLGLTVDTKQVGVPSGYPLGEFLRRCWTALHTFAFSVPATQAAHGVGDVDDAVAMGGGGAGSAGVGASASSSSSAAATRGGGGGGGAASASALSPPLSSNHSAGGAFGRPFEFTSTYSGTGSSGKKKDLFISLSLDLTEGTAAEGRAPLLTVRNTRDESGVTVYYLKSQCSKLVRSPPGGAAAALPSATGGGAGGEGAGPLRSDVEELYAAYGLSCPRLGRKPYENADGATRAAAALLRWEAEELAAEQRRNCGEIDRLTADARRHVENTRLAQEAAAKKEAALVIRASQLLSSKRAKIRELMSTIDALNEKLKDAEHDLRDAIDGKQRAEEEVYQISSRSYADALKGPKAASQRGRRARRGGRGAARGGAAPGRRPGSKKRRTLDDDDDEEVEAAEDDDEEEGEEEAAEDAHVGGGGDGGEAAAESVGGGGGGGGRKSDRADAEEVLLGAGAGDGASVSALGGTMKAGGASFSASVKMVAATVPDSGAGIDSAASSETDIGEEEIEVDDGDDGGASDMRGRGGSGGAGGGARSGRVDDAGASSFSREGGGASSSATLAADDMGASAPARARSFAAASLSSSSSSRPAAAAPRVAKPVAKEEEEPSSTWMWD